MFMPVGLIRPMDMTMGHLFMSVLVRMWAFLTIRVGVLVMELPFV
jgi:hypothetical protein